MPFWCKLWSPLHFGPNLGARIAALLAADWDTPMLKVLVFVVFLVAYALWSWGCLLAINKTQSDLLKGRSFWSGELLLVVTYGGFFAFIYLLSGLWSLRLVVLFFLAAQLGALVGFLLNQGLGAPSEKTGKRVLWAGKEMDVRFPRLSKTGMILVGLVSLSYPIVAGVFYFHYPRFSEPLKILVVKYSILLLILGGYPLVMTVVISMLASENLDEDSRQLVFVNQLSGMIPTALIVSLAIWAFGIGGTNLPFDMAGIRRTMSVQALLLMLAFFAVSTLIPYMLGAQRAKRRGIALLKKERDYLARLADILETPTASLYGSKLSELRDEVTQTKDKFTADDTLLTLAADIEKDPAQIPPAAKPLVDALEQTRDIDPRFRFLDYLSGLAKDLEEIIADLQKRPSTEVEAAAGQWSKKFETRKTEADAEINAIRSVKPLVTVALGSVATLVISAVLDEVGKTSWQLISHLGR
jgi:hypothetical protein